MRRVQTAEVVLVLLLPIVAPTGAMAGAMTYDVTAPRPAGPAGYEDFAQAINNRGQVIGAASGTVGGPGAPMLDVQQPFIAIRN